jgi:hypothetical protein
MQQGIYGVKGDDNTDWYCEGNFTVDSQEAQKKPQTT